MKRTKLFAAILAVITVLSAAVALSACGSKQKDGSLYWLDFTLSEDETYYIVRGKPFDIIDYQPDNINIPATHDGIPVKSIGHHAFYSYDNLKSITIPNSVTDIGDWAFYECTGLKSISIPNSVTSIYSYTFKGCTGLTSITIPSSVTSIGRSAFENCSALTDIYYTGSESDWAAIAISNYNDALAEATIHYNHNS